MAQSKKTEAKETKATALSPEDVARSIFAAIAAGKLDAMDELVDADAVDNFLPIGEFRGRDAIRGFFEELLTAFPEFDMQIERIVADDHVATVQWQAAGTFTGGPFLGIDPNGKYVEMRGVDVMEVEDGRMVRNTIYYDGATFARAVGLLPRAGSTVDRGMLAAFNAGTRLRSRLRERRA